MIKINPKISELFPVGHTIVFFHAHADDESFLSAGLINELIQLDRRCVVVYAATSIVLGQEKTVVRQQEALKACSILGLTSILYLGFCEPKYLEKPALRLIDQNVEDISQNLYEVLHDNIREPIILISYDKNGGYGNPDHKVIYKVGRYFKKKYKNLAPFLYEITINREIVSKWLDGAKSRLDSKSMPKLSFWSTEFGLSSNEITHYYELTEDQLKLKYKALAAHESQISVDEFPLSLSANDFREVFGREFLKNTNGFI